MKEKGSAVYQLFLLVLSIYVLVIVFIDTFYVDHPEIEQVLQYIDVAICIVFLFDFLVNFLSAKSKLAYMKWGWIDLISSIPMIDPLRWGRLSRVVRIIRFIRTLKSLKLLIQTIQNSKMQSFTLIVILITFITYTVCASLILEFEEGLGGSITTANDALWWAFLNIMNAKISIEQTISTEGMVVTLILNKVGLMLFAYFNAVIIAWLIQKRNESKKETSISKPNG